MYLITGATGNIGKQVSRELILHGKKVRAVSRHENKMKELYDMGAEAFVGDLTDEKFVLRAFEEISAAFCMVPTHLLSNDIREYQRKIGQNYLRAIQENEVKNVILLSSIGAHIGNGCGVVDGLAEVESHLSELTDVNILILRPAAFMENIYSQIPMIKNSGTISSVLKPDVKMPMVATADIAEVVLKHLLQLDFRGHSIEYVLGPKDYSYAEITHLLSRAMDMQNLQYVQLSEENARQDYVQSGFVSENVADAFTQMSEKFNTGEALSAHTRTPENTTPTTFEEFAKNFVYAYQQSTVN